MRRRRALALCAAGVSSVVGCLSVGTDPPNGGDATARGVTVEDPVVRKAVTYSSSMGSSGVLAGADRQYVVASVASVESSVDLTAEQFAFATDDGTWGLGLPDTAGAANRSVAGYGGGLVGGAFSGDGQSFLAFSVPSPLSASNPVIRYHGGSGGASADAADREWPLPEAAAATLAAPAPRFRLEDLAVTASVSQGATLSPALRVTNVSEIDGRFLAAFYWPSELIVDDDESRVVEREVAAGETAVASPEIDTSETTAEDGPVTLSVRGHVTAEREVAVRDAGRE